MVSIFSVYCHMCRYKITLCLKYHMVSHSISCHIYPSLNFFYFYFFCPEIQKQTSSNYRKSIKWNINISEFIKANVSNVKWLSVSFIVKSLKLTDAMIHFLSSVSDFLLCFSSYTPTCSLLDGGWLNVFVSMETDTEQTEILKMVSLWQ